MSHTPAPWWILGDDEVDGLPVREICAGLIGEESFVSVAYVNGDVDEGITKATKANAQLIAAAPELLEALKLHHKFSCNDSEYIGCDTYKMTENIIAKAEGK